MKSKDYDQLKFYFDNVTEKLLKLSKLPHAYVTPRTITASDLTPTNLYMEDSHRLSVYSQIPSDSNGHLDVTTQAFQLDDRGDLIVVFAQTSYLGRFKKRFVWFYEAFHDGCESTRWKRRTAGYRRIKPILKKVEAMEALANIKEVA